MVKIFGLYSGKGARSIGRCAWRFFGGLADRGVVDTNRRRPVSLMRRFCWCWLLPILWERHFNLRKELQAVYFECVYSKLFKPCLGQNPGRNAEMNIVSEE